MSDSRVPIIAFASTKGGVGKTTLAYVIATSIARWLSPSAGYRIACIDCDPNGTLDAALRKTANPDILSLPSDAETLLPTLREAQRTASMVLIDLEGSANQAMLYACGKADRILIPAQPSAFDVREARKTADVVSQAADLVGREIALRVVLTRTPVLKQRVAEHSRSQFERAGLPVLPVGKLGQRTAFQTMTYTGAPPFSAEPSGGAAANVEAIVDAVTSIVGLRINRTVGGMSKEGIIRNASVLSLTMRISLQSFARWAMQFCLKPDKRITGYPLIRIII